MARTMHRIAKAIFRNSETRISTKKPSTLITSRLKRSPKWPTLPLSSNSGATISGTSEELALVFRFIHVTDPDKKGIKRAHIFHLLENIDDLTPASRHRVIEISLPTDESAGITPQNIFDAFRLIGHAQHGRKLTPQLLKIPSPLANIDHVWSTASHERLNSPVVESTTTREQTQDLFSKLDFRLSGTELQDVEQLKADMEYNLGLEESSSSILSLKDDEALTFQNILEKVSSREPPDSTWLVECNRWMRKLARHSGVLPNSLFLQDVIIVSLHPVACGGFADVYLGSLGSHSVALKVLRFFPNDEQRSRAFKAFCQEALFWRMLKHPNVVPFLGLSRDLFAPRLSLISPWMKNGNAMQYLEKQPLCDRLPLLRQAAEGLCYLHTFMPVLIHGDIKAANILINDKGNACLADLGLICVAESNLANNTTYTSNSEAGSVRWMSPEVIGEGKSKSVQSDVYAFGQTMLEIFTGAAPFRHHQTEVSVINAVMRGERPSRPATLPRAEAFNDDIWRLINKCWAQIPGLRPAMKEVIDVMDNCQVEFSIAESHGDEDVDVMA